MERAEIIDTISKGKKTTPVKVYLKCRTQLPFKHCHVSVSYTHLDVYKRQMLQKLIGGRLVQNLKMALMAQVLR